MFLLVSCSSSTSKGWFFCWLAVFLVLFFIEFSRKHHCFLVWNRRWTFLLSQTYKFWPPSLWYNFSVHLLADIYFCLQLLCWRLQFTWSFLIFVSLISYSWILCPFVSDELCAIPNFDLVVRLLHEIIIVMLM